MEIALCTSSPIKIIRHIADTKVNGLYFLELGDDAGLEAAKLVRRHDPRGFIVFIAANAEYMPLTFEHKVEALSYIEKTDEKTVRLKVEECMEYAYDKHVSRPHDGCYIFKGINGQRISCGYDEILFFETESPSTKRIILHTKNRQYIFYNTLGEIAKELPIGLFFHCHKSYIINVGNLEEDTIMELRQGKNTLTLPGEKTCLVSTRKRSGLLRLLS
ncbi:MAG: LytTR family DNA-binding domain-containing protein [Defluviitaleaceae bacterium]|nr:LytTR family DNA-binding domain-containing protein [Defluviitaleaceae bacterium]MCL2199293.1 LytTR family DNA-binding domain-containing protein [Defluviitaleaceae bacterium]